MFVFDYVLSVWLTRISDQAPSGTNKALARWGKTRMIKNTVCYWSMPVTVQAGLRIRKLLFTQTVAMATLFATERRLFR